MAIRLGPNTPDAIYLGSNLVTAIYLGSNQVYSSQQSYSITLAVGSYTITGYDVTLTWSGATAPTNAELREDGFYELREDGTYELRE